jgi:hypothetical protein
MQKDDTYFLHQTPGNLARDLIQTLPLCETDVLYEPFRGEGAFFNHFPAVNPKDWSEIIEGRDYKDFVGEYDWVITNPPFQLETGSKRVNSFWFLLDYYTKRARKGVAFLANHRCFSVLTPKRMKELNESGWNITNITVCTVKKWAGRYYFITIEKKPSTFFNFIHNNY